MKKDTSYAIINIGLGFIVMLIGIYFLISAMVMFNEKINMQPDIIKGTMTTCEDNDGDLMQGTCYTQKDKYSEEHRERRRVLDAQATKGYLLFVIISGIGVVIIMRNWPNR